MSTRRRPPALLVGACSNACSNKPQPEHANQRARMSAVAEPIDVHAVNEAWRAKRLERLKDREGWLSLIALHFVTSDELRIDGAILPPLGERVLGTLHSSERETCTQVELHVDADFDEPVTVDDQPVAAGSNATVQVDSSQIRFGSIVFRCLRRGDKIALRARDRNAALHEQFDGIPTWPIDPSFRVSATLERFDEPRKITMSSAKGTTEGDEAEGYLCFELEGETHRLLATNEGDPTGSFFIVFGDKTTGKETYGGGRMIYVERPVEGSDECIIDFNQAYNPPCIFTPFCTCPLPPKENRLKVAIQAGEKTWISPDGTLAH